MDSGNEDEDQLDHDQEEPLREQDRFLPIANVARIMKKSVPKNGKIAKEAKDCVQECVSEFVSFITSEASERCQQEKRKTINGEDILFAMATLGFDNYVEPLKIYLQKFRESMKTTEKAMGMGQMEGGVDELAGSGDESFSKKRKEEEEDSELTEDELTNDGVSPTSSKRRKKTSALDDSQVQEICQALYEVIRNQKTSEGQVLCEPFIRAPKRRNDPDYYAKVRRPMDMVKIQSRVKAEEYNTIEDLSNDVKQLVNNAKTFYQSTSVEYKQALDLWHLFSVQRSRLVAEALGEDPEQCSVNDDEINKSLEEHQNQAAGALEEEDDEATDEETVESKAADDKEKGSAGEVKVEKESTGSVEVSEGEKGKERESTAQEKSEESGTADQPDETEEAAGGESSQPRVPVLKLKVGSSASTSVKEGGDGTTETKVEVKEEGKTSEVAQSMDTSASDVETIQSMMSSGSEMEDEKNEDGIKSRTRTPGTKSRRGRGGGKTAAVGKRALRQTAAAADEGAGSANEDKPSHYELLFSSTLNATDNTNRSLSDIFRILPSRKKYAEYYKVIKNPMDLRTIARKIQLSKYKNLDEMFADLQLMLNNAKTFNEPGSRIYKDAGLLKKIIMNKKQGLDQLRALEKPSPSRRGASKTGGNAKTLSSKIAELESEDSDDDDDDDDDDSNDENDDDDLDNVDTPTIVRRTPGRTGRKPGRGGRRGGGTAAAERSVSPAAASPAAASPAADSSAGDEHSDLWILFNTVRNYKTAAGISISEPFVRLPSKKMYPDYYQEIDNPISLTKIQTFLKNGVYQELDDVAEDLDLLFNNARQYNVEESQIYKDAAKLQQVMNQKKMELQRKAQNTSVGEVGSVVIGKGRGVEESGGGTKRKRRQSVVSTSSSGLVSIGSGVQISSDITSDPLKCRLLYLYKTVLDFQHMGRKLSPIFMCLPLKKDYPDYYKVISEPIDLNMIDQKIKADKYPSQQALMADLELMFKNARHYNEEGSQVYKDSEMLEKMITSRVRALPPVDSQPLLCNTVVQSALKAKISASTPLPIKLGELYNAVRDYSDSRGRVLSTPFMKLPAKTIPDSRIKRVNQNLMSISSPRGNIGDVSAILPLLKQTTRLREDYPEYYDIIKKPIDMQRVYQRLMANQYNGLDDMVADIVLMCDNACKFNEPDSLIYKDALTLQRVCMEKKAELSDDGNTVPDVQAIVQSIMVNLYMSTINHADEEGRCYFDSFLELPQKLPSKESDDDATKATSKPVPTFEHVRRNLDKGLYRRLDRFQDDMFDVFNYAREVSSIDSQVYEDSVELQMFFIDQRDMLCRKGEVLLTPALSYTQQHLTKELDQRRKQAALTGNQSGAEEEEGKVGEASADTQKSSEEVKKETSAETDEAKIKSSKDEIEYKGVTYNIGDYVYIEPRENAVEAHIVCIERHYVDSSGDLNLYGCWFLRPSETFHIQSRKFLQKEVFKSDFHDNAPFSKVTGKCCVMFVKEYFKYKPENIPDEDVFVCESRYSSKLKQFKKIKIWQMPKNDNVEFIERDKPLQPIRVASVFAAKSADQAAAAADESEGSELLDKVREVVKVEGGGGEEGCTYYEQYCGPCGWIKLGDHIYMKSDSGNKLTVVCIEKLWTTASGESMFLGSPFWWPADVEHCPTRLFYKKELLRSSNTVTGSLSSVTGRCSVLSHKEYTTSRLTEIQPEDVYICESKYQHEDRLIKKYTKTFKRNLSVDVCDDEIYFFKKPILPTKEPSPLLSKVTEESVDNDDDDDDDDDDRDSADEDALYDEVTATILDNDDDSLSIAPTFSITQPSISQTTFSSSNSSITPRKGGRKKIKEPKIKRTISGYILYAAECRKQIISEYPSFNFGEVSKEVGIRWKALPRLTKDKYEDQARVLAAEAKQQAEARAAAQAAEAAAAEEQAKARQLQQQLDEESRSSTPGHPNFTAFGGFAVPGSQLQPQVVRVSCASGLQQQQQQWVMHPSMPGQPVPFNYTTSILQQDYQNSNNAGVINPNMIQPGMTADQSQMIPHPVYQLQQQQMMTQQQHEQLLQQQQQAAANKPTPSTKPPTPVFVSVPPRTQRVVHSEAYLRYIENLTSGSRTISDFDSSLSRTKQEPTTQQLIDPKLPYHWLGNGPGRHDNAVSALYALHDLMLKDVMNFTKG